MIDLTSDKHQWHRFTATYDAALSRLGPIDRIVEFGLLRGDSVRWLRNMYPNAEIFGVDILPLQPTWPQDKKIRYFQLDQGDESALIETLKTIGDNVDLIIEDGSHFPVHQASCLRMGLPKLRRGGLYILEDIHTSHRAHEYVTPEHDGQANALNLLLAIQHIKESGKPLSLDTVKALSSVLFFSTDDVEKIFNATYSISFYRRASLPLTCWSCGTSDFDYVNLKCRCGVELYGEADSMTALVTRN